MIEQIELIISASSLSVLEACGRKFEYYKIRHLGMPGPKDEKLERGDLIHRVCDFYYKGIIAGQVHEEAKNLAIDHGRYEAISMDLEIEAVEYFLNITRDYLDYANEHYHWKPLYSEEPFSLVLFEDDGLKILLEGKIDLVIEMLEGQQPWVDHKSSEKSWEPTPLDNQFLSYGYAFRETCNFGLVNQIGLQKTLPSEKKFKLKPVYFNDSILDEWRDNTIFHCKMAEKFIRSNFFPMNHSSCRFCQFKEICKEPTNLREHAIELKYEQRAPHDLFGDN
jgi:hypothetical protein